MKKYFCLLAFGFWFLSAAHAADPDLLRVQQYMNAMPPTHAQFIQETASGQVYEGEFWIKRPGRLRFEYTKPSKNFVVADGAFIHFWDAKMGEASDAPIGSTLADFILKDKITFDDTVKVTGITRKSGMLDITLVQTSDPGAGTLTLMFENQPLSLRGWRVADATGAVSTVSLINPVANNQMDPRLFIFKEPGAKHK